MAVFAQTAPVLPLMRVSLFSSGVGYFEHRGTVNGPAGISLPFPVEAVNDVLKSLTITDPASASPQISYPASDTLFRTLGSLSIDLSGNPGIPGILENLRGEELEVLAPNPIRGRIVAVESRRAPPDFRTGLPAGTEFFLSLATPGAPEAPPPGIRVINLADITSYAFTNPAINADLDRALDLLMESRNNRSRNLTIRLDGAGSRTVSLSYVIPQAVWKVSYRLDLSGAEPVLHGWAIIDNDSDTDWNGVELSLTAGRPVSFVQDLYSPYRLARPVLPLAIPGAAEARSYASGGGAAASAADSAGEAMGMMESVEAPLRQQKAVSPAYAPVPSPARVNVLRSGGLGDVLQAAAVGGLFEFTVKNPVTLARRQSAMLPLVEGTVAAVKTLVFSGERAAASGRLNPAIGAELTNTTGMKLPAGPITVYDGGTYSGDALIDFFPDGEKRLISFGEDMSVSGSATTAYSQRVSAVTISGGIMTVTRKVHHRRTYTLRNASGEGKRVVVEHPITEGAVLVEPAHAEEKTASLYRFVRELPANGDLTVTVREETPAAERLRLAQFRPETFADFIADGEIPENLRTALSGAVERKGKADDAKAALEEIKTRRTRLTADQDRIRRNLEAAGNQTPQGQEYLRRLAVLDAEIDALVSQTEEADKAARAAQSAYEDYLNGMEL
jgi:hypothetical protein